MTAASSGKADKDGAIRASSGAPELDPYTRNDNRSSSVDFIFAVLLVRKDRGSGEDADVSHRADEVGYLFGVHGPLPRRYHGGGRDAGSCDCFLDRQIPDPKTLVVAGCHDTK